MEIKVFPFANLAIKYKIPACDKVLTREPNNTSFCLTKNFKRELTTILFVGAISTVIVAITSPDFHSTHSIGTLKLIGLTEFVN